MRFHVTHKYFVPRKLSMAQGHLVVDAFDDKETLRKALRKTVLENLSKRAFFTFGGHPSLLNPFNHVDADDKYLEPLLIETDDEYAARMAQEARPLLKAA